MKKNKINLEFRDNIQKSHINYSIYIKNKKRTELALSSISKNLDNQRNVFYSLSKKFKFNFNKSDLEEEYNLYENIINNVKIKVKKYDNFITLMYESKNNIDNNFLYYI